MLPTIDVRIAPGAPTQSFPGVVVFDANVLEMGTFAWGIVQHEFAHQLDFLLLDDGDRKALRSMLGGQAWCWNDVAMDVGHGYLSCERFASTVAWSFWQSPENALRPGEETVVRIDPVRLARALSHALGVSVAPPLRPAVSSARDRRAALRHISRIR